MSSPPLDASSVLPEAFQLPAAFTARYLHRPSSESEDSECGKSEDLLAAHRHEILPPLLKTASHAVAAAFRQKADEAPVATLVGTQYGCHAVVDASVAQIAATLGADVVTIDWLEIVAGERGRLGKESCGALAQIYEREESRASSPEPESEEEPETKAEDAADTKDAPPDGTAGGATPPVVDEKPPTDDTAGESTEQIVDSEKPETKDQGDDKPVESEVEASTIEKDVKVEDVSKEKHSPLNDAAASAPVATESQGDAAPTTPPQTTLNVEADDSTPSKPATPSNEIAQPSDVEAVSETPAVVAEPAEPEPAKLTSTTVLKAIVDLANAPGRRRIVYVRDAANFIGVEQLLAALRNAIPIDGPKTVIVFGASAASKSKDIKNFPDACPAPHAECDACSRALGRDGCGAEWKYRDGALSAKLVENVERFVPAAHRGTHAGLCMALLANYHDSDQSEPWTGRSCFFDLEKSFNSMYGVVKFVAPAKPEEGDTMQREVEARRAAVLDATFCAQLAHMGHDFKAEDGDGEAAYARLTAVLRAHTKKADDVFCVKRIVRVCEAAIGLVNDRLVAEESEVPEKLSVATSDLAAALQDMLEHEASMKATFNREEEPEDPLEPLLKDLNKYEERLRPCIVKPEHLSVSFDDVCVPARTVEGIRTIVSLPLMHPDYFKTGLLGREAIGGVLLYGPPGTGKTMLCRAVAKECGARMIQIQPSDINDMWVGESEKLVKAVFTLARRIAPCVVFIDEMDALFRPRSCAPGRNTVSLQVLVEFMQEMDGLKTAKENKEKGIVIVGATNRPFDLDDAVLRRLPRRMMIDLPTELQREKILGVHLKGEDISGITLAELATMTNTYSGSDLKNMCVSAAMASVKDCIPAAWFNFDKKGAKDEKVNEEKNNGEVKRVIRRAHFMQALGEVVPSCTENMGSLQQLRAWDSVYATYNRK